MPQNEYVSNSAQCEVAIEQENQSLLKDENYDK